MARKQKEISRRQFLQGTGAVAMASLLGKRSFGEELTDSVIDHARIHPGIGVARIGNSTEPDGYFIGPEITDPSPTRAEDLRDQHKALKRQAARFRIYAYNKAGEVIKELTARNADIEWQVRLANRKAEWYQFHAALDIDESKDMSCPRRNADVAGKDRQSLVIDTKKSHKIRGENQSGSQYCLKGNFMKTPVLLGDIRTDDKGRLLVLGGMGKSESPQGLPIFDPRPGKENTFNNADGWYDDTSDGPVHATVHVDGVPLRVDPSWVIVAPPNYAPDVIGWRTLYDLLVNTYVAAGMLTAPTTTSFTNDLLPVLQRLSNLQWVNKGFADAFGKGTAMDFNDPLFIAKLADRSESELRKSVYSNFRIPGTQESDQQLWPMLYGDSYGSATHAVDNHLLVPQLALQHLKRWLDGNFINDWNPAKAKAFRLSDIPLKVQPAMLDKAALHFCLADAFHPGCEVTWPMRRASMYRAPFRIKERQSEESPDYGDQMTPVIALKEDGPVYGQAPGDLTRWMALPWQGDTAFCRSGYEPQFNPYLPTFWPARVPNHVLTETDYETVTSRDKTISRDQRIAAFKNRKSWFRSLTGEAPDQMMQMVKGFSTMGVIAVKEGVANDPELPAVMFVESLPEGDNASGGPKTLSGTAPGEGTPEDKVQKAGWKDSGELETFRRIMGFRPKP